MFYLQTNISIGIKLETKKIHKKVHKGGFSGRQFSREKFSGEGGQFDWRRWQFSWGLFHGGISPRTQKNEH